MATEKHELKISSIIRETADAVSIAFEVPDNLRSTFSYEAGQYIIMVFQIDGKEVRRSYSFSSSPLDAKPTIAVKRVPEGVVSPLLVDKVQEGDVLTVMTPRGKFTAPIDPDNETHYVLYSGGSGITPILSILRTVLAQEPKSRVTLFYGNRDEASIIYHEKLKALQAEYGDRCKVVFLVEVPTVSWKGEVGRLDRVRCADLFDAHVKDPSKAQFFVCGPSPMMHEVQEALKARDVPKERQHIEYFTPPKEESAPASLLEHGDCALKVTLDGDAHNLVIKKDEHVLDQVLDRGLDAPYSCMGGVCTTCRAKVMSGEVKMVDAYALDADEIAEGYILTCSTYAVSDDVEISYDEP